MVTKYIIKLHETKKLQHTEENHISYRAVSWHENLLGGDIRKCGSNDVLAVKVVKVREGTFNICFLTQWIKRNSFHLPPNLRNRTYYQVA